MIFTTANLNAAHPRHLVFKSDNLYAKLMEHTSMKEDLKLD